MPAKMYLGLCNAINSIVFKAATTEATTEAQNIITKNDRLSKFLESSNNTVVTCGSVLCKTVYCSKCTAKLLYPETGCRICGDPIDQI